MNASPDHVGGPWNDVASLRSDVLYGWGRVYSECHGIPTSLSKRERNSARRTSDRRGIVVILLCPPCGILPPKNRRFPPTLLPGPGAQPPPNVDGTLKHQLPLIVHLCVMQVSVPMELFLVVRKAGSAGKGEASEPGGHWQQLSKVVRGAHRPVVFEVDGLAADTR